MQKERRERFLNVRELGNYLARASMGEPYGLGDHGVGVSESGVGVSEEMLAKVNQVRSQVLGQCEFSQDSAPASQDGNGREWSLPMVLTRDHLVTWCLGEVPLVGDDAIEFYSVEGLATDAALIDDICEFLKFDGTKYDLHLAPTDRAAADLIRRAVTQGPRAYLKRADAAPRTPTRAAAGAAAGQPPVWTEDAEAMAPLMVPAEGSSGKSKYFCNLAFKVKWGIRIAHNGVEVDLTPRGALLYKLNFNKLKKSVRKFNALLQAGGKRGKMPIRFVTSVQAAKLAEKNTKKRRARTNTEKVKELASELSVMRSSRRHRTRQLGQARSQLAASKSRLSAIRAWLEATVADDYDGLSDVQGLAATVNSQLKFAKRGDPGQKWEKARQALLRELFEGHGDGLDLPDIDVGGSSDSFSDDSDDDSNDDSDSDARSLATAEEEPQEDD